MRDDLLLSNLTTARRNPPPGMARGVDLSIVRDKRLHQHRWVIIANFAMPDSLLETMVTQKQRIAGLIARGREIPQFPPVPLPMTQETMVSTEGPGCMKCGVHWENPEDGYGKLCQVSDGDFAAQYQQGQAELAYNQQQAMEVLVEKARDEVRDMEMDHEEYLEDRYDAEEDQMYEPAVEDEVVDFGPEEFDRFADYMDQVERDLDPELVAALQGAPTDTA